MTDYIPGSAYSAGFQARMQGQPKTSGVNGNEVYNSEWLVGWEDAHTKVINEARANSGCTKPKCCKNFIQD
jgi:ribosome modulation factor